MKKLYSFYWDCDIQGELFGLFIAEEKEIIQAIGNNLCFGKVFSEYFEVYGTFSYDDIKVISDDQEKIEWLEGLLGKDVSGFNPLNYLEEFNTNQ